MVADTPLAWLLGHSDISATGAEGEPANAQVGVDRPGRAERIFHRVGAGVVRIGRAAISDLDVELLVPERVAEIFGAGAVVLRGIGDRSRRVDPRGLDLGAEEDAVDLGAGAAHVRIVGPQVPVVVGRITIVHRGGIAANAEIGLVRVVHDIPLDQGGVGGRDRRKTAAGRPRKTAGISEHLVRQSGRKSQARRSHAVVERARAGAVDVRRLVPLEAEIMPPGLRDVELILPDRCSRRFSPQASTW